MDLRATHLGYAYQDLLTAIQLVDVALERAERVLVDTKIFEGDRFDDVTCAWRSGERRRLQIKHTDTERELASATFTNDRRRLRLDLVIKSVAQDLHDHAETTYRLVLRDTEPVDDDLTAVLCPVPPPDDPGPALPGLSGTRWCFDAEALLASEPWRTALTDVAEDTVRQVCSALVVDVGVAGFSGYIRAPGPMEQALLRRVSDELGAGRPPNRHRAPEDVALALIEAAKTARSRDGSVTARELLPQLDLAVDFGAVREGHPVDRSVEVSRPVALNELTIAASDAARAGAAVVVTGAPGIGKSWLCEQLADQLRADGWIAARHHCWLGSTDTHRDSRVLTDVVIGSLLRQLEAAAPSAVAELRPRYAATVETLAAAIAAARDQLPDRQIALIVDGLDHITRVRGRLVGTAVHHAVDAARGLVEELAQLDLPSGVTLVLASQPGDHLTAIGGINNVPSVTVPPLTRDEVRDLMQQLGVFDALDVVAGTSDATRADAAVALIHSRSRGNTLYATYLCRQALGAPSDVGGSEEGGIVDPLDRLRDVPASATDLDEYYGYLLRGLSNDEQAAIALLAVCDFAVTARELCEIFPATSLTLPAALRAVAPIVTTLPAIGGLKIHHESFSRFIRARTANEAWLTSVRSAAAAWLTARGFFTDTRAFRHLPELLADLDRTDDLAALIGPDFLTQAIAGFQPPAAIMHTLTTSAAHFAAHKDWPALARCVELRRAADGFESEAVPGSVVTYSDVLIELLGVETVAATLLYDGSPTVPPRWGLQLCAAVDRAGAAAPWAAYLTARDESRDDDRVHYGDDSNDDVFLAELRGHLRLPGHGGREGDDSSTAERVSRFLDQPRLPPLRRVLDVLLDGLGHTPLLDAVPLIESPTTRARVLLYLANLAAHAGNDLPSPRTLAAAAWATSDDVDARTLLRHGLPIVDVAEHVLGRDPDMALGTATDDVLRHPNVDLAGSVGRWLMLLDVGQQQDRQLPTRLLPQLSGVGFFRAWLRFAVATVGLRHEVATAGTTASTASATVRVALEQLAGQAQPFNGQPRACDLYAIHRLVHRVIQDAVALLSGIDLEPALDALNTISDGTTTSTMGMGGSGPLITTDLLAILSRTVDHTGAQIVHRLMTKLRQQQENRRTLYPENADFELEMARVSLIARDRAEALACWSRAARYLGAYGSHKDTTIDDLLAPLPNLAGANPAAARVRLAQVQPLTYLVAQRTDGRGTWSTPHDWWRRLAELDPHSAATLSANVLLAEPGLPDALVDAAHHQLLSTQATHADPIMLAALRITAGPGGRDINRDIALLDRLNGLPADDEARTEGVLPAAGNAITSTYDDQPLMYSSSAEGPEPTAELRDAAHRVGADGPPPRPPKPKDNNSRYTTGNVKHITATTYLHAQQRPELGPGARGVLTAIRDHARKAYDDDANAPRWTADALANAIGWRLLQIALADGTDVASDLLNRVADEFGTFGATSVLADLATGLDARRDIDPTALAPLAAEAYVLAFAKIRGGGGWLSFAGRDRLDLWERAHALDPMTATATLARQVVAAVAGRQYGTFGVTQALVAAFAARPPDGRPAAQALAVWDAAFSVIEHRLPGNADVGAGSYDPSTYVGAQDAVDQALCCLALATLALPDRAERRRALTAATILLAARPEPAQRAAARVLAADLGAGPLEWLVTVIRDGVTQTPLIDELAVQLEQLATADALTVRVRAADLLSAAGRQAPDPPATPAHPMLTREISAALSEDTG